MKDSIGSIYLLIRLSLRKCSATLLVFSLLLPIVVQEDAQARPGRGRRARTSASGDEETSGASPRRPRGAPGVYVVSEVEARHAESINPAAICTEAQAMMHNLQTQLGNLTTAATGGAAAEKYTDLIANYNHEVSRFALFDGVQKVINGYNDVVARAETAPTGTVEDSSGRIRDITAIGNVVALQGAIDQILTDGVRIDQLATRFSSGLVCPNQNVIGATGAVVEASVTNVDCSVGQKIPVLYRALEQKCESAAANSAVRTSPMCQSITTLSADGNRLARDKVRGVLGAFHTSYMHAYNVGRPATPGATTVSAEQARADLGVLNSQLTSLGTTTLGSGAASKSGMAILSNQMDTFSQSHLQVTAMEDFYRSCLANPGSVPGRASADCVSCYETNARSCLPATQPTTGGLAPPRVTAAEYTAMTTRGLRASMIQSSNAAITGIRSSLDSPLIRAAVSGYRVTLATGAPVVPVPAAPAPAPNPDPADAPATAPAEATPALTPAAETLSIADATQAQAQFRQEYGARYLNENDQRKAARVAGGTSLNRSLSSIVESNQYNELKASLIRGRNQAILQDAAFRGQNISEVKGLLKDSDFSDDKTFHYEMLQNLLGLTTGEPASARVTLNCLRQGPAADAAPMTMPQLTALRTATGNALAEKFRNCMQELNDNSSNREKFLTQKNASRDKLLALQAKINGIEQSDGYRHKQALQQHVSAIAQTACTRNEDRMRRMSCNLADTAQLQEVEFFIAQNGQIISSINRGVASPSADLLGQLKGMRYFCAQALGGDASSHPALCNAGFAATPTAPVESRREEALVAEHRRLLDEYYEDNDSRYGMSPSGERRGTVLTSSLLGTAGATLGGLGSLWVGSMAFDSNLAMMEQQAIQMKTFQALSNAYPFPAFPFGFSPVSAPFNGAGGFIVPPGSVPASGGYNAYFSVGV